MAERTGIYFYHNSFCRGSFPAPDTGSRVVDSRESNENAIMRPTLPHRPVRPLPVAKAVLDNPSPLRPSSAVRTLSGEHLFCVRGEPLPPRCPIVYSKKNRLCSLHLHRLAVLLLIRPSSTQNFAGCSISWQRPAPRAGVIPLQAHAARFARYLWASLRVPASTSGTLDRYAQPRRAAPLCASYLY
jgi:hypothetical protein